MNKDRYTFILKTVQLLFFLLLGLFIISCSQESNSTVSKGYHNVTAHYNAYFLARERLSLLEEDVLADRLDDYNRILPLFHFVDTNFSAGHKEDIDYIVEKATYPIELHKNSKWVDDSYVLIGKARRINNEMEFAVKTFKYVNTKSPNEQTRYQSLILLMQCHLKTEELYLARKVKNYLDNQNQNFNKDTKREYHLTCAEYYRMLEEFDEMVVHVDSSLKLIKIRDRSSRTYFISGQLHQKLGNDSIAYARYEKVLKKNPPYELMFFTKLNMSQVYAIENDDDIKRIKKYFAKFLDDEKNTEYQDRIYYDMAYFEYKQGNTQKALEYITMSVQVPGARALQKAYSYRFAGDIYYDRTDIPDLLKYRTSKLYYDSTVSNMTEEITRYDETEERQDILTRFVTELETVELQDSLQSLAKLDSAALNAKLTDIALQMEENSRKEAERQARLAEEMAKRERQTASSNSFAGMNASNNFLFYNMVALTQAKITFVNQWGDRKLEDNWRRSKKEVILNEEIAEAADTSSIDSVDVVQSDSLVANTDSIDVNPYKVDKSGFYKDIPFTEEELQASNDKKMEALFSEGKILYFELKEREMAIIALTRLETEYPDNPHYVEALYLLYLMCQESPSCDANTHRNELITRFPHSIYGKLAENPNYLEDYKDKNKESAQAYETAYNLYLNNQFVSANKLLSQTISQYTKSDIYDKMVFLKILTLARIDNYTDYLAELKQFKEDFPTSPLVSYANELLTMEDKILNQGTLNKNTEYIINPTDSVFYVIAVFEKETGNVDNVAKNILEFNTGRLKRDDFRIRRIDFTEENFIVTVKEFPSKEDVLAYLEKLKSFDEFRENYKNIPYNYYWISSGNFNLLLSQRTLDPFITFYNKNF